MPPLGTGAACARQKKATLTSIFTHTLGAFLKTLLLRGGVLDGKQGWLLAVVNAQYTFNKYTRAVGAEPRLLQKNAEP